MAEDEEPKSPHPTISDEEWDNPPPLTGDKLKQHQENVQFVRNLVVKFAIAKIGILTLVAVILWKFFGKGHH